VPRHPMPPIQAGTKLARMLKTECAGKTLANHPVLCAIMHPYTLHSFRKTVV